MLLTSTYKPAAETVFGFDYQLTRTTLAIGGRTTWGWTAPDGQSDGGYPTKAEARKWARHYIRHNRHRWM